jgi:hypothetical protein
MSNHHEHYDNEKGSLYKFAKDHDLNAYEFDIIKRIVRCRKKGQFKSDLEKSMHVIQLYLEEQEENVISEAELEKTEHESWYKTWMEAVKEGSESYPWPLIPTLLTEKLDAAEDSKEESDKLSVEEKIALHKEKRDVPPYLSGE